MMVFLVKAFVLVACVLFGAWLVIIFVAVPILLLWCKWRDERDAQQYLAPSHDDEEAERSRLMRSIALDLELDDQQRHDLDAYTLDELRTCDAVLRRRAEQREMDRPDASASR